MTPSKRFVRVLSRTTAIATAGIAALVAISCEGWWGWDDVFDRVRVGYTAGWRTSDGAMSVQLPEDAAGTLGDRTLWLFGDTATFGTYPSLAILGNSIAVTNVPGNNPLTQPSPTDSAQVNFWAKAGSTVVDITSTNSGVNTSWVSSAACTSGLLWPRDGIWDAGMQRALIMLQCYNTNLFAAGKYVLAVSGTFNASTNAPKAPNGWTYSLSPLLNGTDSGNPTVDILWGACLTKDPGSSAVYIYGTKTDSLGHPTTIVVAAVTSTADLFDYSKWYFGYTTGFQQVPPTTQSLRDSLAVVAPNAQTEFSIDPITIGGITKWVNVIGRPGNTTPNDLVIRTSDYPWGPFDAIGTPGSRNVWTGDIASSNGIDPPVELTYTTMSTNSPAWVYAVRAHPHLSALSGDVRNANNLLVSYFAQGLDYAKDSQDSAALTYTTPAQCATVCQPPCTCSNSQFAFGALRFAPIPLDNLYPWCTLPNCGANVGSGGCACYN